ncbi:MAG TPA: hypothetical protein VG649_16485 [Candidatus Angelobacter sp.]|nr:hypothetical protein [Candidatus Angelobacter sp.]
MSGKQPNPTIFFFDGTHGKLIPDLLRGVGMQIRIHRTMGWQPAMKDTDWIRECGKMNLAIITGDKSIEEVPEERQAVIDAKCKVFMLDDTHITKTQDWGASLLVGRERILEIAAKANGPFFVTIQPCRMRGHVSKPRFIEEVGGGWKPSEETATPEASEPAIIPQPVQRPNRKQQGELFTDIKD